MSSMPGVLQSHVGIKAGNWSATVLHVGEAGDAGDRHTFAQQLVVCGIIAVAVRKKDWPCHGLAHSFLHGVLRSAWVKGAVRT